MYDNLQTNDNLSNANLSTMYRDLITINKMTYGMASITTGKITTFKGYKMATNETPINSPTANKWLSNIRERIGHHNP